MNFLRDSALQGAALFIAVFALILQFPQHLKWLLPLAVFLGTLLFIGHRYSSIDETNNNENRTTWGNRVVHIYNLVLPVIRNWVTPILTILVFITSAIFTVTGIYNEIKNYRTNAISTPEDKVELTEEPPYTSTPFIVSSRPTPISPDMTFNGTIAPGEIDDYLFVTPEKVLVRVQVQPIGSFRFRLQVLYYLSDKLIAEKAYQGVYSENRELDFAPEPNVEYLIRVQGYSSETSGSYVISITTIN